MHAVAARLTWTIWFVSLGLWGLYLTTWGVGGFKPMPVYADQPAMDLVVRMAGVLTNATMGAIGALIASHHPRNPIGWMLCVSALLVAISAPIEQYAVLAMLRPEFHAAALPGGLWFATCLYAVSNTLFVPIVLLFPDGRLPGPRWWPLLALAILLGVVQAATLALRPGEFPVAPAFRNPLGIPEAAEVAPWLLSATVKGIVLLYVVATGSLLIRLRYAQGEPRQQLKWVAFAAVSYALALAATYVVPPEWFPVLGVMHYLLLAGLALSLGIALLRYRLYDIDVVINKTLVYGALALVITAVYIVTVVGAGALLGSGGEPNLWLSLLATAIVAVAFEPVRDRLQMLANRLVYGHRASPYDVLAGFSRRMSGALSVEEVLPRMAEAAARGVGAGRSQVLVYLAGGGERAVVWPTDARDRTFTHNVSVLHQGELVGEISVYKPAGDPLRPAEEQLLEDLAAQAGLAIRNVRLTLELQARLDQLASQAEELRASRQRIVAAQDAERRRLERDLHDGAQQQMVALAIQLRLLKPLVGQNPTRAKGVIEELQGQVNDALAELRDLARGIFPSVLGDRGLVAAVQSHLSKAHLEARLEVDPKAEDGRFPPELETAVYFCIREALQNSAKHAPGAPVAVRLAVEDGRIVFQVRDEGPGFELATGQVGTGLQGMADRLAAVSGVLHLHSVLDQGTIVEGWVPLQEAGAGQADRRAAESQEDSNRSGPNSALERKAAAPHSSARAA